MLFQGGSDTPALATSQSPTSALVSAEPVIPGSSIVRPRTLISEPSPPEISSIASESSKPPVPGPLDLSSAQGNRSAAPPLDPLASARFIKDLKAMSYPNTIKVVDPGLNIAAAAGKFV
jgi:hypothetical protein